MERTLASQASNRTGQEIKLIGWVKTKRDHGKLIFIDLRDRTTLIQVVFNAKLYPEIYKLAKSLNSEDVIEIKGKVNPRPESTVNPNLQTGTVEVEATNLDILSTSQPLPFPIDTDGMEINEELRLKYRYLDLRRERLTKTIRLRAKFVQTVREYLFSQDFIEIETPLLTKSTPEGSRDFLVPSRLHPGNFYALPQSPQQYKQLLMVAGFERYFQLARCLRDEDLRADRGFEHTQIDLEMSFVKREDVMAMVESMITYVFEKMGAKIKQKPFPIITYKEAMAKYHADKFDLRTEEDKKENVQAFAWVIDFPFFEKNDKGNWTYTHNPFSDPLPEDKEKFLNGEIESILTTQYDLICNGYEVGGGSIRSHDPNILEKVFEVIGHSKEEIHQKFGHMLEAFKYGVPPHGGMAPGVERLLMCLTNEKYLREVVAFPQTSSGTTSVMDAPSEVEEEQLHELGIKVIKDSNQNLPLFDRIVKLLDGNKVKYKLFEHQPVFTSEEAAKLRGTDLKQGAKALVMIADKKPIMIVISAAKKIDSSGFKKAFNFKDLRMATPEEVKKFSGVEIGAVPPFGNLTNLNTFVDASLGENKEISFNAGLHTKSISMAYEDWNNLVKPELGNFSA